MPDAIAEILHDRLPVAPWMAGHTFRLPGIVPIAPPEWLLQDEVFAAQMTLRDRLIRDRPEAVHAELPGAGPAAQELLAVVLTHLDGVPGYARTRAGMIRPDGIEVPLDAPPLITAGRLVQEDLCLLEKPAEAVEHVLTGAILCFPSNWTLAQKIGMPLMRIHLPVAPYDETMGRRVQRLFDAVRPGAPLMRANLIPYAHPALHSPRPEFGRHRPAAGEVRFLRVERQVMLRLPETGAVVFSIHTHLVRPGALSPEQRTRLAELRPDLNFAV